MLYFKHMSRNDLCFPKIEVLLVYLALQFLVIAKWALWFFGGDQVWYQAYGFILFQGPSPPLNFEMSCTLFAVAIDCYSCLWYFM